MGRALIEWLAPIRRRPSQSLRLPTPPDRPRTPPTSFSKLFSCCSEYYASRRTDATGFSVMLDSSRKEHGEGVPLDLRAQQESLTETVIVLAREADEESAVFLCGLRIVQPLEGERQHVGRPETEDLELIETRRGSGQQSALRLRRFLKGMFALLPVG